MELTVFSNKKAFTLVEVLVSIVILTVGLLGLLQMVNYSIHHNLTNQFRSEAIQIADNEMALEMAKPFTSIVVGAPVVTTVTRANNLTSKSYSVSKTGTAISDNTRMVAINVSWSHKGTNYSHSISSLLSRNYQ